MRAILFGQIGLRKKRFLREVEDFARAKGKILKVFNVGQMMYQCDSTIRPGRILEKGLPELRNIRARTFDKITSEICGDTSSDGFIINSHATFRWSNGLFPAFTKKEIQDLAPDLCITLIDNIQDIKLSFILRLQRPEPFTLKDIIVWREEEMLVAEFAASQVGDCKNYVVAKGHGPELIYKLMFESDLPKAYLSYPITLALSHADTWSAIEDFRNRLKGVLTCFDPFHISEGSLITAYNNAKSESRRRTYINLQVENRKVRFHLHEIEEVIPNIKGQIIARDFKLVEQSDMVIAYFPERDGIPQLSDGASRELAHAKDCTIDRYVIWPSRREPGPFLQATQIFPSIEDFCAFIQQRSNK